MFNEFDLCAKGVEKGIVDIATYNRDKRTKIVFQSGGFFINIQIISLWRYNMSAGNENSKRPRDGVSRRRQRYCLISFAVLLSLVLAYGAAFCGCRTGSKNMSPDWSKNRQALQRSDAVPAMEPESETEQEALKRFAEFYQEYSTDSITSGVRAVYAADAWFGDPFHVVEGIDDIEHYFLVMAEPVEECIFKVDSSQRSGKDYYIRWTMELVSRAAPGERIETIGISHVRFNREGLVVFQQDYWDTGAMFERLPVVGFWTRFAKKQIEKGMKK